MTYSNTNTVIGSTTSISGDYIFDVTKEGYLFNKELGELKIVSKEEALKANQEFDFVDVEELVVSEDYIDTEFTGSDEEFVSFVEDGYVNLNTELLNDIKGYNPENPDEDLSTDVVKYPISKDVDLNIKKIIQISKKSGLTNKFAIAAMLAISKKESGLVPKSESSYAKTTADRIKKVFSAFRKYSNSEVDSIKKNPQQFFDIIYGSKYGNGKNEGYKYRGRGLNQITFKGNYQKYKELSGYDIISDPDLLNTIEVAAKCLVEYFKSNFKQSPSSIKSQYNFTDINSFKNLKDATGAFYHANAGWGKSYSEVVADSTGGRKKAFNYVGNIYETYKDQI
jgi:putative chitinase